MLLLYFSAMGLSGMILGLRGVIDDEILKTVLENIEEVMCAKQFNYEKGRCLFATTTTRSAAVSRIF